MSTNRGNRQVKCGIFIQWDAIKKSKKIFKGQWYTLLCKWVLILIFFLFFWPHAACRIFASSLGIELIHAPCRGSMVS